MWFPFQDQVYEKEMLLEREGKREIKMEEDLDDRPTNREISEKSKSPTTPKDTAANKSKAKDEKKDGNKEQPAREKQTPKQQQQTTSPPQQQQQQRQQQP